MDQRTRYTTVLARAERILGSPARLAAFFKVPCEKVDAWLRGTEIPPLEIFLASLDVIADGPYARKPRHIRVAVIDQR
ncbi:MAG TPA: hypothetical protein VM183_06175 [Burkholderiales bacterium]|nr:hypothetical protein [Burkholderiales bacterium]